MSGPRKVSSAETSADSHRPCNSTAEPSCRSRLPGRWRPGRARTVWVAHGGRLIDEEDNARRIASADLGRVRHVALLANCEVIGRRRSSRDAHTFRLPAQAGAPRPPGRIVIRRTRCAGGSHQSASLSFFVLAALLRSRHAPRSPARRTKLIAAPSPARAPERAPSWVRNVAHSLRKVALRPGPARVPDSTAVLLPRIPTSGFHQGASVIGTLDRAGRPRVTTEIPNPMGGK